MQVVQVVRDRYLIERVCLPVAAAPSVGTTATLAATMSELAWFTGRAGDLVLTIAALHGREDPSIDERRAWVLAALPWALLAGGCGASEVPADTVVAQSADSRASMAECWDRLRDLSAATYHAPRYSPGP